MQTSTISCWKCHAAAPWQPTCARCGVLQSAPRDLDHFALLGLPRLLVIDGERLQARYYELSRVFHPDLYGQAPPAEQAASLANTAALNRAYRTLRDPVERGLYWLELNGEELGKDNNRVPPALVARVFAVQEELEELRADPENASARERVAALGREVDEEIAGYDGRLAEAFRKNDGADAATPPALAEIKTIVSERAYLRTLRSDIGKQLEPLWTASSAST